MENENGILQLFFYNPMTPFGVRKMSRETHKDTKTIMKQFRALQKKRIILRKKPNGKFPFYEANRLALPYKFEKSHYLIKKIVESDIVPYVEGETKPKAIVLFGSVAKGTYHKKSDIDIFIQAKYKYLNFTHYGKKIGHKIVPLFEQNIKQLSVGLRENIYNGYILSGKLEFV